ncbi:MAG: hypothetical protein HKN59_07645, partial [Gammaproteobacteria bacterium]|nr:hypothetical protein [Gammaproteobacteria bacterium]
YVPTPEQKVIFALQEEMVHHYERAKDELEKFECGNGHEHGVAAEESFRKAISACQRIGGHEGKIDSYSSQMLLQLTELLEMQGRMKEVKESLQGIVQFYQQEAQRTDGGKYMLDWRLAQRASHKLAALERSDGNTAAAAALEDQGNHWLDEFQKI